MKVKAIIVDDEAPARSEMRYLLEKMDDIEVIGEASSADEALKLMEAVCYDVAFLDIDMSGMDGIEMTKYMEKLDCPPIVVYTTAYSQFAVRAFEVEATDYLLKPVAEDRLEKAVAKVKLKMGRGRKMGRAEKPVDLPEKPIDRVPVTKNAKTFLLDPEEILFIESQGDNTVVHSVKGKFVSSLRLKDFEVRLASSAFFRSHRSFIVNLDHVKEMVSLYGGLYMLKMGDSDNSEVPVSRRQTRRLKQLLGM